MNPTRRVFLGGVVAAGAMASGLAAAAPAVSSPIRALIDLSRDPSGQPHIDRAAIVTDGQVEGTLAVSASELQDLRSTLASGNFERWQLQGLRVNGFKFVFAQTQVESGDRIVHAVRPGEFLTLRVVGGSTVLATSGPDQSNGRAIEAVYRFTRRPNIS
jgi:hypothetical protein